ncbi:aminotransferase class I/II-fold pyridoxal phosphate-dependent enzyme [Geoalkalibacter halelectricus]|uniref:Aminotransferase class I/II-fold pyridoxal phosphate-dependent enzyme n=1 Tax=Geoalkalibacter halelectricus TaxID=2847045 RepID=A0ABY5ZSE1_9BACT|nr:aminotransferase class I/II-fold pyridoxal phosphate-dependent enzyme [Geoalkalibacter halelectricus]UWZ81548.1 aminotransferase class I/II-fold pyridoxal phosphate-dependent enzyme [Geoalkalibacter halelectricus]
MNPLAAELNEMLAQHNPNVLESLSDLGKNLFFPKGILTQSAEAKEKAHKFNATIGIATEKGGPMYLPCIHEKLSAFDPKDIYPYAPPAGRLDLRNLWREKMLEENPSLRGKHFSLPIVTSALTHGLSIVADLFMDTGDHLILPDMLWGNYNLTFATRCGAIVKKYPTFTVAGGYDVDAFKAVLRNSAEEKGKAVVLLNFPNNPSGYTPTVAEGDAIVEAILEVAESGCKIVAVTDDAYFGLFFEDSLKESLFGKLANQHPNVLAVKLDGATKEEYVWGFRTGFITFADGHEYENTPVMTALEKKTLGIIRATISNCPHPSQTFVVEALKSPKFQKQKEEKFKVMKGRALKTKKVLDSGKYDKAWDYYPFNSGYFMCLKLKTVDAEKLRVHLLDKYGVGTISIGKTDLRIAFSCIEEGDIAELFDIIYQAVQDLS